jgi:hypothetical protein
MPALAGLRASPLAALGVVDIRTADVRDRYGGRDPSEMVVAASMPDRSSSVSTRMAFDFG